MCCVTLTRAHLNGFFHIPHPSFVIPIFRAPTTLSTTITTTTRSTTLSTLTSSNITPTRQTSRIVSALFKDEDYDFRGLSASSTMINQRTFENLILTNTIVAAFCILLMITLTGFLLFLLIPSIRRRCVKAQKPIEEPKSDDVSPLSHQSSFHHFTLGPSRLNPIFESTSGAPTAAATTTTTTQFGTLFHPTTTATTLLHPTFWTPLTPTSLLSATPLPQSQPQTSLTSSTPPTSPRQQHHHSSTPQPNSSTPTPPQQQQQQQQQSSSVSSNPGKPPLPSHPPTSSASARPIRKR